MHTLSRFLTAGLIVLVVSAATAAEKKFDRTFSVSPGGTLLVDTDVGSVDIAAGSAGSVIVSAVAKGSERDLEDFEISAAEMTGGVEVRGELKKGFRLWGSRNLEVSFTIKVPREYGVKVRTAGGDIGVSGLKGDVRGSTSGGDVRLGNIEGPVDMKTSGGNILVKTVTGNLHVQTSGGNVEVESVKGSVDAGTSGGNVRISAVTGSVDAETSGGDVSVSISGGNSGIHAGTSGGNIEIVIPPDVGANIEASTSGGSVQCDMPLTVSGKIHESRVKGTVNGGGSPIVARTSGGNIRIRSSR
jgi:DUF4097 and DUF4098 domain-containing protein YvlB